MTPHDVCGVIGIDNEGLSTHDEGKRAGSGAHGIDARLYGYGNPGRGDCAGSDEPAVGRYHCISLSLEAFEDYAARQSEDSCRCRFGSYGLYAVVAEIYLVGAGTLGRTVFRSSRKGHVVDCSYIVVAAVIEARSG